MCQNVLINIVSCGSKECKKERIKKKVSKFHEAECKKHLRLQACTKAWRVVFAQRNAYLIFVLTSNVVFVCQVTVITITFFRRNNIVAVTRNNSAERAPSAMQICLPRQRETDHRKALKLRHLFEHRFPGRKTFRAARRGRSLGSRNTVTYVADVSSLFRLPRDH